MYPLRDTELLWRGKSPGHIAPLLSRAAPHAHVDIFPLYDYKHPIVRDIIWSLKYTGSMEAARLCATLLYDLIIDEIAERHMFRTIGKPLLIPVPLSRVRTRERGFNQCLRIAQEIERLDHETSFLLRDNILVKTRDTQSQAKSESRTERMQNLKGCFDIVANINGQDIIVIDDVLTTGSTLIEIRNTLKNAGARNVLCFTFAH